MRNTPLQQVLKYVIALIWLINGLFCKVVNGVPRHQELVEKILRLQDGRTVTLLIGISEIIMAIWIISGYRPHLNAIVQIVIIVLMNTLEALLAPELLLWGYGNAFAAFLLIIVIYLSEFHLTKKNSPECSPS
ncbi:MAG TPA: DoxX-like family protein [Niabella sp.]